jgi:hypothetical protein
MSDEQPIEQTTGAERKAALVTEALRILRAAHAIDERTTVTAADLIDWYNRVCPHVTDIKILAAAMEIELAQRRGATIEAEGERRGGNRSKVTDSVTLSNVEKKNRSEDRMLYEESATVNGYVKDTVAAGKKPSVNGAVAVAQQSRAAKKPKTTKHTKTPKTPSTPQPKLNETPGIIGFLTTLRAEITRKRKANHDERQKRNWNPDPMRLREQSLLLDWIETELDRSTTSGTDPDMEPADQLSRHVAVAATAVARLRDFLLAIHEHDEDARPLSATHAKFLHRAGHELFNILKLWAPDDWVPDCKSDDVEVDEHNAVEGDAVEASAVQ